MTEVIKRVYKLNNIRNLLESLDGTPTAIHMKRDDSANWVEFINSNPRLQLFVREVCESLENLKRGLEQDIQKELK